MTNSLFQYIRLPQKYLVFLIIHHGFRFQKIEIKQLNSNRKIYYQLLFTRFQIYTFTGLHNTHFNSMQIFQFCPVQQDHQHLYMPDLLRATS
jgi:hypothetical protein